MIKLLVQPRQSTESNNQETFSFFQEFSIFDEIESNFEILANIGGIDLIRELIEILKTETLLRPTQFFTLDFENHFDISIRSHYNEKKPKNFLLKLISQLLLNTSEDITDIATELWKTKTYPNRANANIKTLGLWILNKKYPILKEPFWSISFTISDADGWAINEFSCLLKNQKNNFKKKEISICLKLIKTYAKSKSKYSEYRNYQAVRLLYLLKDLNEPKIKNTLAQMATEEYIAELNDDDFDFRPSKLSMTSGDIPPDSSKNFSEKNIFQIINYLTNFNETNRWGKVDTEGVAAALKADITNDTNKYFDNWEVTATLPLYYRNYFFYEIASIARNKEFAQWDNLLNIIEIIIPSFETNDTSIQPINWIFNHFCALPIETLNDEILSKWRVVLTKFALLVAPQRVMDNTDFWTSAFNSPYGTTWIALLQWQNLSYQKNELISPNNPKLDNNIIAAFEAEFNKNPSEELYAVLGHYSYHLRFWSEIWFYQKVSILLSQSNDSKWIAFMESFLNYGSHHYMTDYFSFFQFLKEEKYLEKTAKHPKLGKSKSFIYFLLRGFDLKYGKEDYDSYAINLILDNDADPKVFGEIIFFFWQRDEKSKNLPDKDDKIRYLWRRMFNILKKNIDNAEFNIIIPSLLRWVDNLAQIDSEAFEWIKFSLEHIHKRYEIGFFLEAIILHIPKQAKEVGNIILIFSENTKVILYRTDEVEKILQALFDNGEKDVLHDVLNNFGRNGHLQFGDLYKKYFPINK